MADTSKQRRPRPATPQPTRATPQAAPDAPAPAPSPAQDTPAPASRRGKAAKRRRQRRRERMAPLLVQLMQQWPAAFPQEHTAVRPLARNIHRELAAQLPEHSPSWLHRVIRLWLQPRRTAYLRALQAGGPRYDLEGPPCGVVTLEQQAHAAEALAVCEAQRQARRTKGCTPAGDTCDQG